MKFFCYLTMIITLLAANSLANAVGCEKLYRDLPNSWPEFHKECLKGDGFNDRIMASTVEYFKGATNDGTYSSPAHVIDFLYVLREKGKGWKDVPEVCQMVSLLLKSNKLDKSKKAEVDGLRLWFKCGESKSSVTFDPKTEGGQTQKSDRSAPSDIPLTVPNYLILSILENVVILAALGFIYWRNRRDIKTLDDNIIHLSRHIQNLQLLPGTNHRAEPPNRIPEIFELLRQIKGDLGVIINRGEVTKTIVSSRDYPSGYGASMFGTSSYGGTSTITTEQPDSNQKSFPQRLFDVMISSGNLQKIKDSVSTILAQSNRNPKVFIGQPVRIKGEDETYYFQEGLPEDDAFAMFGLDDQKLLIPCRVKDLPASNVLKQVYVVPPGLTRVQRIASPTQIILRKSSAGGIAYFTIQSKGTIA
ncbi:MAG: hypothetical protein HQK58_00200 [Deltaproteobacteria bacterium]|nr:hypothetical protein [Deltaproteobacteria bacterium]